MYKYDSAYDLDGDGFLDPYEMDLMERANGCEDDEDVDYEELELEGLDYDELSYMDEEDRREVLEAAGLDPDDYDF